MSNDDISVSVKTESIIKVVSIKTMDEILNENVLVECSIITI